ncbi:hypothetical protein B0H66DRAFT_491534 [Apodospora peruviana]|uniref:Azaphilone pigments biosynthesis cluster protein L N-terminal domain-containing protein n=1 Tax=Apodospora peruviana TaxID=516989 RepID=A0AAE0MAW0_9PEZI|nr:hypothetical protein B0H66DRAFT_491534 [Apodospora peruviana]
MDPLSISVSVITLIQTAGKVSSSLAGFIQSVRQVDSRLSSLCAELTKLAGFLDAVDRTLKQCEQRNVLLSPIDEDVWCQSASVLDDCKASLAELDVLAASITKSAARSGRLWRSTRAAMNLNAHASDIEALQEKIHKSNWALQTMLAVFNVSLSLRGNASQDMILNDLAYLKRAVEHSYHVARPSTGNLSHRPGESSNARVARNLHSLARAAKHFHSNASSTASTIYGDQSVRPRAFDPPTSSDVAMSTAGEMTAFRQERVEEYIRGNLSPGAPTRRNSLSMSSIAARRHSFDVYDFEEQHQQPSRPAPRLVLGADDGFASPPPDFGSRGLAESDADADFELLLLDGFEDLARDSFLLRDFAKAASQLERAIAGYAKFLPSRAGTVDRLKVQLSLCYFFQGEWREAEPLVLALVGSRFVGGQFNLISNLLHALALSYLKEKRLDMAMQLCKQSLGIMKKMFAVLQKKSSDDDDYHRTMGLLATICDMQEQSEYAVILRKSIPPEFVYDHPTSAALFLAAKSSLLEDVFKQNVTASWLALAKKSAVEIDSSPVVDSSDSESQYQYPPRPLVDDVTTPFADRDYHTASRGRNVQFELPANMETIAEEYEQTGTLLSRALTKIRFGSQRRNTLRRRQPRIESQENGLVRTYSLDRVKTRLRRSASSWFRSRTQRRRDSNFDKPADGSFRLLSVRNFSGEVLYEGDSASSNSASASASPHSTSSATPSDSTRLMNFLASLFPTTTSDSAGAVGTPATTYNSRSTPSRESYMSAHEEQTSFSRSQDYHSTAFLSELEDTSAPPVWELSGVSVEPPTSRGSCSSYTSDSGSRRRASCDTIDSSTSSGSVDSSQPPGLSYSPTTSVTSSPSSSTPDLHMTSPEWPGKWPCYVATHPPHCRPTGPDSLNSSSSSVNEEQCRPEPVSGAEKKQKPSENIRPVPAPAFGVTSVPQKPVNDLHLQTFVENEFGWYYSLAAAAEWDGGY